VTPNRFQHAISRSRIARNIINNISSSPTRSLARVVTKADKKSVVFRRLLRAAADSRSKIPGRMATTKGTADRIDLDTGGAGATVAAGTGPIVRTVQTVRTLVADISKT
jgi:hypothetical protein